MTVLAQPVCAMTAGRVALLSVAFKALLSCCGGVLEIQQERHDCVGSLRGLLCVSVCVGLHVLSARGIPQGPVAAVLPGLVDAGVEEYDIFITGAD